MNGLIRLNRTISLNGTGQLLSPCTDNLLYWSSIYNTDFTQLLDKSETDGVLNENHAAIRSNAIQLTGDCSTTFTNDFLLYFVNGNGGRIKITNSADNETWVIDEINPDTLYTIDTVNRTFTIDSVVHYYSKIDFEYPVNGTDYEVVLRFLNSSNTNNEDNVADSSSWEDFINPFGVLLLDLRMSLTNNIRL